ncbi:MAG: hypothetical protein KJ907_11510 [Actinobacteria bacterium]|nr:hypothetical protein [Planctomycetota bacterium]MBU4403345.1 hypothetical protein [Actinomycetota bacterium]MCG2819730.1 DUF5719 family protein [Actinomycetes bacterium]
MRVRVLLPRRSRIALLAVLMCLLLPLTVLPLFGTGASAAEVSNCIYTVRASVIGGHGSVSPTKQWVFRRHTATINITPDTGYHIDMIIDNARVMPVANPYKISKVKETHDVYVTFARNKYTVNASVNGGHGTATPATQSVLYGGTVSIDLKADPVYVIATITDNGASKPVADPYVINNVTANHDVVVTFTRDQYAVNASVSGGHGSVRPPTQTVAGGATASISITPDAGYEIVSISDNQSEVPISNPYVITGVAADHDVVVTFGIREYMVTATVAGGNGTAAPPTQTVEYGQAASIDLAPDPGYHISSITDNGTPVPVTDPYIIDNVTTIHVVVVTFDTDRYPVDASVSGGHGAVDPVTQTVDQGATAAINITPDAGYEIATISDNGVAMPISNPYVINNVTEEHDVIVTFALNQYTVDATVAGGNGNVDPLSQDVLHGGTAVIDIIPDAGYHIASIIDNGSPMTIEDPYVITGVTADHDVVVSFALNQYDVDASVSGGHGTVSPTTQTVNHGATASIDLTPDPGYQVGTITDNGVLIPDVNPYVINNATADHEVVVTFKISDYMVAASAAGGHGTATPATQTVASGGDSQPIVFTPEAGYHISTVTDNGVSQPPLSPYTVLIVTDDHSVVVTFALDNFTVDALVQGGHGAVSPPTQTVAAGATASIAITPDAGYEIATMSDNGVAMPISNPYVINPVNEAHDVVVTFSLNQYAVTADAPGGYGSVDPPAQTIAYGGTARVDMTPDPGYHISSITDNGTPVPVTDPYIIENVTAIHVVVITFDTDRYPVDASVSGGHGAVDPVTQTVDQGVTAAINITPDAGYEIETISDNGIAMPISNPYVINNVTEEHDVIVTFDILEYTVTATDAGGHGSVAPPTQTVKYDHTATIDITPDPGYDIASIIDNGSPMTIEDPYVITGVTADHTVVVGFALNQYDVDASVSGGHGTVDPGTQTVMGGGTAAINIVADTGYHIETITDNEAHVAVANPYILTGVTANHTIVITFAINEYTATASVAGSNGSVTPEKQTVAYGDTTVIGLYPDTDYHPSTIIDNGVHKAVTSPYFIDDTTANHDVTVSFAYDASADFYLAEGSTAWGFSSYICIENPNTQGLNARLTYMLSDGSTDEQTVGLPPLSQVTVNPAAVLGEADFSTHVECIENDTIAVDRTMSWTGPGAASPEAHCSVGVAAPATTWYLPEGSSAFGFETWTLVENPNDLDTSVSILYMTEENGPMQFDRVVPARTRATYSMIADIGAQNASIEVGSSLPVVAERSMYRHDRREGSNSIGTDVPSDSFYLAEGSTAWGFDTFVLVQNPNETGANVTLTCLTNTGPRALDPFTVPPQSRETVWMNDLIADTDFSTKVTADVPIIAERAMYWGAGSALGEACHDSIGLDEPHAMFFLPDGQTSDGRETFTLVANPNDSPVDVMVSYLYADGTGSSYFQVTLPANSRETFSMGARLTSGRASVAVTCLTSDKKILAERSMYWNNRGVGTNTVGDWSH